MSIIEPKIDVLLDRTDNDRFLLRTDQWDADSLAGEIGGRWGQTYLTKAVSAKKQEDER